ncbi:Crp/Fnr family transcriptional regulator [Chitinophaga sp. HK235]|uniref:Crp/Fnr family transcriptional regulator n=1 Tax=Chitinophaga sp. HK235 TaxID=2952571 RepID=UPI001BA60663|nr:Crp/Fnr family transcriptional regulator [Chitinophaga sp. HK235]
MEHKIFQVLIDFLQLFGKISAADQQLISAHCSYRQVKEGTVLLEEGKVARELFFISDGVLKIVNTSDKGNTVTLFFLKRNQFCTILGSFTGRTPAQEGIIAACDSEVIVFRKEALEVLNEKLPYFGNLVNAIIQQGLLDKIQTRNALAGEDATTRYRKFLIRQPDIALRVSLSDIASYLGITQQSLSRIRRNFH